MPQRHALTTHLFTSLLILLVTATVNAQSNMPNMPTKLAVSSAQRTVGIREQTELRIRLLDQRGTETAAPYKMAVTLLATRQKDIDAAKREGKGNIAFQQQGTLALPSGVNTVQTILTIQQGQSMAALRFSSHQAGAVRIYAENEKLVTGALLIVIVNKSNKIYRADGRDDGGGGIFRLASFQRPQIPPAPPATPAAPTYQLVLETDGLKDPELNDNQEYVRRFSVLLKAGDEYFPAPQDIEVRLSKACDKCELSQSSIIIPKDSYIYPSGAADKPIEVSTKRGGKIEVAATPVRRGNISVLAAGVSFNFPTKIRAAMLKVEAVPQAAMANGIESITLRISPVDAGNNPVRNEDEGLEVRNITLSLASRTLGLKFENGLTTIPIKKGETTIQTTIISARPIPRAVVVAEAENGDRHIIKGEQQLEFCFPWLQLGGAMFGGLMFPLILNVIPGKNRKQRFAGSRLKKLWKVSEYGLVGLFLGALAFALVFFGALGMTEFNFNGIPVTIARFPIYNGLAACAIGFFGAVMLATGISIKERLQDGSSGDESPAKLKFVRH